MKLAAAVAIFVSLIIAGCAQPLPPSAFENGEPEMRPEVFFVGTSNSSGVLEDTAGAPTRRFHVKSDGIALPDGSFRLEQIIAFDTDAPATRTWILRRIDAHKYAATLTDAAGPVEGEAYGNLFHLRYPLKTPMGGQMEQWLYLQPDRRTLLNVATVSVLGIPVARLSELITRDEP
jgi:hypothetical protein